MYESVWLEQKFKYVRCNYWILDYVYSSLDSKQSTIALYLDFWKAFDEVNHDILMSKLLHNDIRGVVQSWIKSYLSNRKQCVSIKNCSWSMSNCQTLHYVLHGSMFCQVLFLLLINDIRRSSNLLRFLQFAEDTTAFAPDIDFNNIHATVNRELVGVDNWLKTNWLSTLVQLYTNLKIIYNQKNAFDIKIRDSILTKLLTGYFFGVTLDENFTVNDNINKVST